jgi:hypothetical protein
VWFFSGDRNIAKGIDFQNVPERERVGGTRDLTVDTADPLTFDCTADADCDDSNPCTVNACDVATGACSATAVPDLTSCADGTVCNGVEVCVAGVCQIGTPLVCLDGNECTSDTCDTALGCQFPPVPDGTSCANGTGTCLSLPVPACIPL